MLIFPHCKINLGLDVVARRPDGFHDIETVMFPVTGMCDGLEIIRDDKTAGAAFTSSGNAINCPPEHNLVIRAYELIHKNYGIGGVKIHLHKAIPSGGGIGGGSSDAAFTLRRLSDIFELGIGIDDLSAMAESLGSDVPFFLREGPQFCWSKGELMRPSKTDLSGKWLLLVKPDMFVSTAEAYRGITPRKPEITLEERIRMPLSEWKDTIHNAFEDSVFNSYPILPIIKQAMYDSGAVYASMSGSGSSIYGIYDSEPTYALRPDDKVFRYRL